jgi:hypothetical protein
MNHSVIKLSFFENSKRKELVLLNGVDLKACLRIYLRRTFQHHCSNAARQSFVVKTTVVEVEKSVRKHFNRVKILSLHREMIM